MIAVDIAFLLPKSVEKTALRLNRAYLENGSDDIVLDPVDRMPHISLCMGCVSEENLPRLGSMLGEIAGSFSPLELKAVGIARDRAWIQVEKSRDIELLHEILMIRMSPLLTFRADRAMFLEETPGAVNDLTVDYVRKFFTSSSFENFTPHITVGRGDAETSLSPFFFTADRLSICHLGNFCTCRKVLYSHRISGLRGDA